MSTLYEIDCHNLKGILNESIGLHTQTNNEMEESEIK